MSLPVDDTRSSVGYKILRDGRQVRLREMSPEDRPAVEAFFLNLSRESVAQRFHSGGLSINARTIDSATNGHVVVAEMNEEMVALASYLQLRDPQTAEMGIVVTDALQGIGLGTALFERLAEDARAEGIRRFIANELTSNTKMLRLLAGLGFRQSRTSDREEIEVTVDLKPSHSFQVANDARRHIAARTSLDPIFRPRTVAVVGASRKAGSIGHALFRSLLAGGFDGTLYPIHPISTAIQGVRAYPSARDIPEELDLGVIVVPAAKVLEVAKDCLDAGAKGLVVISAGFAEIGPEGRQRQTELLELCRSRGARLVGPNCLGILINRRDGVLNASFSPAVPPAGRVAFASQSGALGIAILEEASRLGIGISSFISMGNKADVSSNDLLERWEDDRETDIVALYLESFGNPRRFSRIVRRVSRRKPVLVVKGGRTDAGRRAAASHTAALAGSEVAIDALFQQSGAIRIGTLEELFDLLKLLGNQPIPAGNRVAIITNAGGLSIICADACENNALKVPALSSATQAALRDLLPVEASVSNPVDMLAAASPEQYSQVVKTVLADPDVDAVIVLFIPPLVTRPEDVAKAVAAVCEECTEKPILACFVGAEAERAVSEVRTNLPVFRFPESAARALSAAVSYRHWLRRPAGTLAKYNDLDIGAARAIVDRVVSDTWLAPDDAARLLQCFGLNLVQGILARTPEETAAAQRQFGGAVAVKLVSKEILHKSDVGGVKLGIESPEAAAEAFREIQTSLERQGLGEKLDGVIVQPMLTAGVECLVGVVNDKLFGPLIGFGLGGVLAEVLGDVRFRLTPLTDIDADELIAASKSSRLFEGYRGSPASDTGALKELLQRLSRLVEEIPELAELDMNPVMVMEKGAVVLDARIRIARASP